MKLIKLYVDEIPTSCSHCIFRAYDECGVLQEYFGDIEHDEGRLENCPLTVLTRVRYDESTCCLYVDEKI